MANVTKKIVDFKILRDQPLDYEVSLTEKTSFEGTRIVASQVHGNQVQWVNSSSKDLVCDGLITSEKEVILTIRHADCQAALFFDPIETTLAVVHSGWRGSTQNIYQACIDQFCKKGSDPKNILVCIGPSLGPENAEFINYKNELPQEFHSCQIKPNYFDFWAISRMQLEKAGVAPEHIEIAEIDTYANSSFPSYRRDKTTKRMTTNARLAL